MTEIPTPEPVRQPSAANFLIAERLRELAAYLEILDENAFKVRAYRSAAQTLELLPEPVERLLADNRLSDLPGFGTAIVAKARDILATGTTKALEDARRKLPATVLELSGLPGIGAKTIRQLYTQAGIDSAAALTAAIEAHTVRDLPGFGERTEEKLRDALERHGRYSRRMLISDAHAAVSDLLAPIAAVPGVSRVEASGEARRGVETVGEIVIAAAADDPSVAVEAFAANGRVLEVSERSDTSARATLVGGFAATLHVSDRASFGALLLHTTGSAAHVERLRQIAASRELLLTESGLFDASGRSVPDTTDEAGIYRALGMDPIAPELREDRGEIAAAMSGALPKLIGTADLRGDLHAHTSATDGKATIEEMARAAMARGYEYCAITDHSQSLTIANGLTVERLRLQIRQVRDISQRIGFPILAGAECDIKADGAMDFPDEVLAELDFVIGSVHSRFRLTRDEMTARMIRAIENPHVDLIAHPTGRLLNQREPYELDLERVFAAAARTGTALEINSFPERQDLCDTDARAAKDAGVRLMIDTDAHAPDQFGLIDYGISVARRAWLEPTDVVNTLNLTDLREWLNR